MFNQAQINFDIAGLPSGIYVARISGDAGTATKRLVKS